MRYKYDNLVDYGGVTVIFCIFLFMFLVLMKVINYIACSWLWVFAPLWISAGLFAVMLVGYVIAVSIKYILRRKK